MWFPCFLEPSLFLSFLHAPFVASTDGASNRCDAVLPRAGLFAEFPSWRGTPREETWPRFDLLFFVYIRHGVFGYVSKCGTPKMAELTGYCFTCFLFPKQRILEGTCHLFGWLQRETKSTPFGPFWGRGSAPLRHTDMGLRFYVGTRFGVCLKGSQQSNAICLVILALVPYTCL